jgi:hypothetical protein
MFSRVYILFEPALHPSPPLGMVFFPLATCKLFSLPWAFFPFSPKFFLGLLPFYFPFSLYFSYSIFQIFFFCPHSPLLITPFLIFFPQTQAADIPHSPLAGGKVGGGVFSKIRAPESMGNKPK